MNNRYINNMQKHRYREISEKTKIYRFKEYDLFIAASFNRISSRIHDSDIWIFA